MSLEIMLRWMYPFISGLAFWAGVTVLLMAVGMARPGTGWRHVGRLGAGIAGILIILSAEPLAGWIYGVWLAALTIWLAGTGKKKNQGVQGGRVVLVVVTVAIMVLEWGRFEIPAGEEWLCDRLYVVGDSVSAGIGGPNEMVWPGRLALKCGLEVRNLAVAGATVKSARDQVLKVDSEDANHPAVLLEIGGNDMLGRMARRISPMSWMD